MKTLIWSFIFRSGLLTKWQVDSKGMKKVTSEVSENTGGHGGKLMQLRFEHVEGAFLLILIGLSFSVIIFLLELLVRWLVTQKTCHQILKTMERFICHA